MVGKALPVDAADIKLNLNLNKFNAIQLDK